MNILQVNKFQYIKGGSEVYLFALEDELWRKEYTLAKFAMYDDRNRPSPWSDFFVGNIDYDKSGLKNRFAGATKIIYSFEARQKIGRLLDVFSADLAHLHIFQHQLSASILPEIKKRGIPIVYTAHDLKSICPNYKMLTHDGICERCKGGKYYQCFIHKCVKDSRIKSLINVVEMYFHAFMGWYELIDLIIAPSDFYRRKLAEFRFPEDKIVHLPNFIDESRYEPCYEPGDYFLYFGRLSEEKGVSTLVEAMRKIKSCRLVIAGTGPAKEKIDDAIDRFNLTHVELVGYKTGNDLAGLIRGARFTVLPSEWYENGSIAQLESMAYGKPVVGADIGGIPEHIDHGLNGLIFESGNPQDLADKLNCLVSDNEKCISMGKAARCKLETDYAKKRHLEALTQIYEDLHAGRKVSVN